MTAIVGIAEKGTVYIGGDSAGVGGLSLSVRDDEKVFINGPFIMGFTTSFRMGQLLHYKFNPPKQTINESDMQYMVTSFIDAVRQCFKESGYGSGADNSGGCFLVGYKGTLYTIYNNFQVGINKIGYSAVGCGADLCLGSMHSTVGQKPKDRIKKALEAATEFSAGVSAPYLILHSK